MPREWMDYVKGDIETKFGMMEFALTEANHVHLSSGSGSGSDPFPGLDINNVIYYISLHLHREPDGTWVKRSDHDPYMSRKGSGEGGTPSASKKAYEAIRTAWEEFISNEDGEIARVESELAHTNNRIIQVEEDLEKAAAAAAEIESARNDLLVHEREVQEGRGALIKRGGYPTPKDWSPRGRIPGES